MNRGNSYYLLDADCFAPFFCWQSIMGVLVLFVGVCLRACVSVRALMFITCWLIYDLSEVTLLSVNLIYGVDVGYLLTLR